MSIRSAAKGIIVHENQILLDWCQDPQYGEYYSLPGGGQNQYETIGEALVRECLEETGYTVIPGDFVGLYEEIYTDETYRQNYPEYSHRIYHIFRCGLAEAPRMEPTECDMGQIGCKWVDIADLSTLRVLPQPLSAVLESLVHTQSPLYLGTHWIR